MCLTCHATKQDHTSLDGHMDFWVRTSHRMSPSAIVGMQYFRFAMRPNGTMC